MRVELPIGALSFMNYAVVDELVSKVNEEFGTAALTMNPDVVNENLNKQRPN